MIRKSRDCSRNGSCPDSRWMRSSSTRASAVASVMAGRQHAVRQHGEVAAQSCGFADIHSTCCFYCLFLAPVGPGGSVEPVLLPELQHGVAARRAGMRGAWNTHPGPSTELAKAPGWRSGCGSGDCSAAGFHQGAAGRVTQPQPAFQGVPLIACSVVRYSASRGPPSATARCAASSASGLRPRSNRTWARLFQASAASG